MSVTAPQPTAVKLNKTEAALVIPNTVRLTATLEPSYAETTLK